MEFNEEIQKFSKSIPERSENIMGEEQTKNALIAPFIEILGYDFFDIKEVDPEFTAEIGTKKGEKVDYAIKKDGKPIILIECKTLNADLNKEKVVSQLFRYYSATPATAAKFGILTNGVIYQFFTDIDDKNRMDDKPFLEINILEITDSQIEQLKNFRKSSLNLEVVRNTASQLKVIREIIELLNKEFSQPSEELIKFFSKKIYEKTLTPTKKEKFTEDLIYSMNQFLDDKVNDRIKFAREVKGKDTDKNSIEIPEITQIKENLINQPTPEENEGYYIVKAILHGHVDPSRVAIRAFKYNCGILLDDSQNTPICRICIRDKEKYVVIFDNFEKKENKIKIENLNDIFKYAESVKKIVTIYNKK